MVSGSFLKVSLSYKFILLILQVYLSTYWDDVGLGGFPHKKCLAPWILMYDLVVVVAVVV